MSAAGIYVDVDGKPTDLSEVSWYIKAPCGCCSGVTMAYLPVFDAREILSSPAQAMASMYESKAERDKYEALGFTAFAAPTSDATKLLGKCTHEPRWGYEKRPEVDGMAWAVGGYRGEQTRVQHLVAVASVQTDDYSPPMAAWTTAPLCGGREKSAWSSRWFDADGKVECSRCVAKARKSVTP